MTKNIKLSHGFTALVDDNMFDFLSQRKWSVFEDRCGKKYAVCQNIRMHRVITNCPENMEVDHIDGDGLNNQLSNLRVCTKSQNMANRKINKNNTTGFKGVRRFYYNKNKYTSKVNTNGKQYYLGIFNTAIDAAKAYDKKARELFGHFAKTNFEEKK